MIDLRSDTVTMPTQAMYDKIVNSKLGDDVFQEDPTVNQLEKKAAQIMGKSAGLLVPSGTMGNLVSILVHCERGTEILLGDKSHTFYYEVGGISAFGGIHSRQLKNQKDGTIKISDIKSSIRVNNIHFPITSAITLENTHNLCNGSPLKEDYINKVVEIAHANNMKVHIDGARIFNAAVSLGVDVKSLVENVDSVTFCLSKGLCAPIGSIICGEKDFIQKARRIRKALGGGMRQAGIIAASGLVSLNTMIEQIKEDHNHIKMLIEGLSSIKGLLIDKKNIRSNILYFEINENQKRSNKLYNKTKNKTNYPIEINIDGVCFLETSPNKFRLVTHYGITTNDIKKTLKILTQELIK